MSEEEPQLTKTEIEGMMMGGYTEGASISITCRFELECSDGEVWEVLTSEDELVGVINPRNALTGVEIQQQLRRLIGEWKQKTVYESELSADSSS